MATGQVGVAYKRRVLLDEIARRIRLMRATEIDREFACIENGLEVRIRFVAEPFTSSSTKSKP